MPKNVKTGKMPEGKWRMWLNIDRNCMPYEGKSENYLQMRGKKQFQVQVWLKLPPRYLAITHRQRNAEYEMLLNEK